MKLKKIVSWLLTVVLLIGLCGTVVFAVPSDCYVSDKAGLPQYQVPTIDGTVNADEWGDPIIVTSPDHAASTWTPNGYRKNDTAHIDADQRAKIWLTNDADYIYIAGTLDKESQSVALGSSMYRNPHFKVMVGAQGGTTSLKQVDGFEQRTVVTLSFRTDGTKASHIIKADAAGAVTNPTFDASNYSQRFDAETGTYHYEMRIPYSMTNIDLAQSNKISISVMVGASKYGSATSGENNRYNIGGNIGGTNACGVAADTGAEAKLYQGKSVPLTLNTQFDCYVWNKAGFLNQSPTIDGTVNTAEWGDPIIVTSPDHAAAAWTPNGYRRNDTAHVDADQRAKIWLANDGEYIYIAGTLDKESQSVALGSSLYRNPAFKIMLGAQGETTALKQVEGFEQRTVVTLSFRTDGTKASHVYKADAAGTVTNPTLSTDNYSQRFDAETGTYHYEMRIPYSMTNIDLAQSDKISIAVMVGASKYGSATSGENNRYNIGGDYGGTPLCGVIRDNGTQSKLYEGKSVSIALNTQFDCYVLDRAAQLLNQGPTIDGTVTAGEWGNPVIVTAPEDAASQWTGGYWKKEAAYSDSDQRAKVWITNDSNYIYIAGTLDKESEGVSWGGNPKAYAKPMMRVMLGTHGGATALKQVSGFEQRTTVQLNFGADGTAYSWVVQAYSQTPSKPALGADNYSQRFDEETGTYHYEMRIPYSLTNIDLSQSNKISIAVHFGASNHGTNASEENNRYNIGGAASGKGLANDGGTQAIVYEGYSLPITLNPDYDCYVKDKANPMPETDPIIDGLVSVEEWGEPVIVTSPADSAKRWSRGYWKNEACDETQRAKVWLTNDRGYIYVVATLDKESLGEAWYSASNSWAYPQMKLMLAAQGENTDLIQVNKDGALYEQRSVFTFWFDEDGNPTCYAAGRAYSIGGTLDPSNWSVSFDEQAGIYTYEMRIPYNMTNIDPTVSTDIAMSVQIGASNYGTHAKKENNRYNIGGAGVAYDSATATTPYQDNCLLMSINALDMEGYMKDSVAPFSGNVSIDGKISDDEWGEPIIATYPTHCKTNGNVFWTHHKPSLELGQQVKIYATNDEENLYFAATIDRTDFDDSVNMKPYARAHFMVSIGRYDEETDMERIVSRGQTYERCTLYVLSFDMNGELLFAVQGRGFDRIDQEACDYVISYDATTRTYTYELRIPISSTTLSFGNNNEMTACFTIAPAYEGNNQTNRYNIGGTGTAYSSAEASKFSHTGQSMRLALNENNYSQTIDEFDVDLISSRYATYRVANPESGDMPIGWVVACSGLAFAGIVVLVRVRRRRIIK